MKRANARFVFFLGANAGRLAVTRCSEMNGHFCHLLGTGCLFAVYRAFPADSWFLQILILVSLCFQKQGIGSRDNRRSEVAAASESWSIIKEQGRNQ